MRYVLIAAFLIEAAVQCSSRFFTSGQCFKHIAQYRIECLLQKLVVSSILIDYSSIWRIIIEVDSMFISASSNNLKQQRQNLLLCICVKDKIHSLVERPSHFLIVALNPLCHMHAPNWCTRDGNIF